MRKQTLAKLLSYCGILPFLAAALVPIIQAGFLGLDYTHIILTYGAVIASFIAGIHWGLYLFKDSPVNLFVHSNIIALLAWFAVAASFSGSVAILIFCFIYLLVIDKKLLNANIIESWYMHMRIIVSTSVILTLLIHSLFHWPY